ncbi:hypothetical protein QBC40DRAFT_286388 [Triangularia verruculosa]|uniref:Uncharacterized protein n=1 Tax=Triangularia verruculosa TaxID=2587418 RepID=A0AAN6XC96_9PEZI|nr:hypothetical protein QBC40DRAFT_286388 [Triangularia verruculosa]
MTLKRKMEVLQPSLKGRGWVKSTHDFVPETTNLPRQCYFFLNRQDYPDIGQRRDLALEHFKVPAFVGTKTCFDLNGFFGSQVTYDDTSAQKPMIGLTTWFRVLIKMVRKIESGYHDNLPEYVVSDKKGYRWFETTVFTRWDYPDKHQVLIVDAPPDFPEQLACLLQKASVSQELNFQDPLAMHTSLIDQIIVYSDVSVWRIRDPVRQMEKSRMRTGAIFSEVHEMSRHAIHSSEILEATIDTLKDLQRCRTMIHDSFHSQPPSAAGAVDGSMTPTYLTQTYKHQAHHYAQFQISLLKNLKLRADSNRERLKNEINTAFNNLTMQDNSVLKSIALLTMVFLPATFFSSLFSTTFFNYGDDGEWQVSGKMWIYWVTTLPATILIVILWRVWLGNSDAIVARWKQAKKWALEDQGWKGLWRRRIGKGDQQRAEEEEAVEVDQVAGRNTRTF